MWSFIALLFTVTQAGIIIAGHVMHHRDIIQNTLVFGSPVSLLINLMTHDSIVWEHIRAILMIFVAQVLKYFCFFMAQLKEGGNAVLYIAVLLEAGYLAYSAYWLI